MRNQRGFTRLRFHMNTSTQPTSPNSELSARISLLSLLLLFPACVTITRHGDARLVEPGKVQLAPSMSGLDFPKIAIGYTGHYHFAVRDLPRPIYPETLEIIAPRREQFLSPAHQPWSGAVLSISLIALDGTVFLRQVLAFESEKNGVPGRRTDGIGPSMLFLRSDHERWNFGRGPAYLSYDVDIDVVSASRRTTDAVRINAYTF